MDGVLDLHTFQPKEVKDLVPTYINEARKRGLKEIRIIHGKGQSVLKRIVYASLEANDLVENFRDAAPGEGGWGATIVRLKAGKY